MRIKTVAIIGLGSLGIMYGDHLSENMPKGNLKIVADRKRIERYKKEGIYCNEVCCDFNYINPHEATDPADLVIFAVKFNDLPAAIEVAKNQVGPDTVIMSLLNGIGSEELIGSSLGMEKILYCVAQGMNPIKEKNKVVYHHMGFICFGSMQVGVSEDKINAVKTFFEEVQLPHEIVKDMRNRLWGKFMLNVGVNQAVTVFECDYGGILKEGMPRDMMIAAMKEVIVLSEKEKINLTEVALLYWLQVLEGLNPRGKPSMRQDIEAKRESELELFAGAVLALSKKHHIISPVNQMFYDKIKEMESHF